MLNSNLILITQLCRFFNKGGQLIKGTTFFSCTQSELNKQVTVSINVEDYFPNKYSLIATINHSGILNSSYYWDFFKSFSKSYRHIAMALTWWK